MANPKPIFSFISNYENEENVRNSLATPVKQFVDNSFGILNNVQQATIPRIIAYESTLVMSPTGSGKTLAAFLGILSELYKLEEQRLLEKKIYVLYISPLKALNNDIHKNLEIPLRSIKKSSGTTITAAKRTGDTTSKERAKLLRLPPHILITTPESLALMLTAPKFKEHLRKIKWLIIDEIHSLADNKRGSLLSLCIERLEHYLSGLTRIGLSATVEPVDRIAHFLIGNRDSEVKIIDMTQLREIEIEVLSPVKNLIHAPYHLIKKRHLEMIDNYIEENTTSLIFTNTRNMAEQLVYDLVDGFAGKYKNNVAVHHGSLDKSVRLSVEENLKQGRMKGVFTSTSLELGIDIGSIDLTVQLGSPKTVRAILQRIGRSGHSQELTSVGKILVFNRDDLIECTAIAKLALEGRVDQVRIPNSPVDVLIQMIIGMALEKKWNIDDAFEVICKAYSYKDLSKKEFYNIILAASNPTNDDDGWKYGHIWFDDDTREFGRRKRARQSYMQNIGTIPDTTAIEIVLQGFRTRIGQIAEKFSEKLTEMDIFILGGKTYQYIRLVGNKIIVKEVYGKIPNIPSWIGEAQSRTREISSEISRLFIKVNGFLSKNQKQDAIDWLQNLYPVGESESKIIVEYIIEQNAIASLPTDNRIILESYMDPSGGLNIIVLSIFGRETNSVFSQALAAVLGEKLDCNIAIITTDNGFLLRIPPGIEYDYAKLFSLINDDDLEGLLTNSIKTTELFRNRFRHVASRSLMILKQFGKNKIPMGQQQRIARWLLSSLSPNFPIINETVREILYDTYNLPKAKSILRQIKSEEIQIEYIPPSGLPSPFTHDIILNGHLDVVMLEDRRSLLLSLHKQVLSRLLPEINAYDNLLEIEDVETYYRSRLDNKILQDARGAVLSFVEYTKINKNFISECSKATGVNKEMINEFISTEESIISLPNDQFTTLELLPYYGATHPKKFWNYFVGKESIIAPMERSEEISPELGWEMIFYYYLKYSGPKILNKIAEELEINLEKAQAILWRMQQKNIILVGNFIGNNQEYILLEDRDEIQKLAQVSDDITEDKLKQFRLNKMRLSKKFQSSNMTVEDYLRENGPSRDPIELIARLPAFSWFELRRCILNREVYFGRFLGRRLVFMHKDHIKYFVSIVRSSQLLDELADEIFTIISEIPGVTQKEISRLVNQPYSKIQSTINFLEQELYISRTGWELTLSHGGFTRPGYIILPKIITDESIYQDAIKRVLLLCLNWYGLLTLDDLLRITRLPYPAVESGLKELKDKIKKKNIFSYLYYGIPEDIKTIEKITIDNSKEIHLLSPYDPYFYTHGATFRQEHLPRRTRLSIIQDGIASGHIEVSIPDKDILQVLNIQINKKLMLNRSFIQSLGIKLLDLGRKAYQVNAVFIEEIQFKAANHQENKSVVSSLINIGYKLDIDYLVAGAKNIENYTMKDIIETRQINWKRRESQKYSSVQLLFDAIPMISVKKAPLLLNLSYNQSTITLSKSIREGIIHHKDHILYSNTLWDSLSFPDYEIGKEFTEQLIKPSTLNQLASSLHKNPEEIRGMLFPAVRSGMVESISPYSPVIEYRLVTIKPKSREEKLSTWINFLISNNGPITFSSLKEKLNLHIVAYRIELLLILIDAVKEKRLLSATIKTGKMKFSELVYFNNQQREILQNPTRKQELPEWGIYPIVEGLFEDTHPNYSHVVVHQGNPVANFKMKRIIDEAIIEDLYLDAVLLKEPHNLRYLIGEIENHLFSSGLLGLRIKHIHSANPNYWLGMASSNEMSDSDIGSD